MTGGSVRQALSVRIKAAKLPPGGLVSLPAIENDGQSATFTHGTGSDHIDICVFLERTLEAGANETLDLYDGSLDDVFDAAAAFRNLKGWAVWVSDGGDSSGLTIGAAASNPHTLFMGGTGPTVTVYPNGQGTGNTRPAGAAVTSTARNVKFANNGAVAVTYRVLLLGSRTEPGSPMGLLLLLTYP